MRVLLDENLPRQLAALLIGHEVSTVVSAGWGGVQNGKLLTLAEAQFDVFVTLDQGIPHQQNLKKYEIAVLLLRATTSDIEDLKPLVPKILAAILTAKKRVLTVVGP